MIFCNASLLTNLHIVEKSLNIHCNTVNITTNIVGDLEGYGTVWYHKKAIANILSLYRVTEKFHVEFNSRTENNFVVWRDDGSARYFKPVPRELYYCNVSQIQGTILANDGTVHTLDLVGDLAHVNTVNYNLRGFTQRQINATATCRRYQNSMGLTTAGIIEVVDKGMMTNYPITKESIKYALSI